MTEVETDVDELRENWTPKQCENFEEHMQPTLDRLETLADLAEENGADVDVENARKWYLRTYRPKKRGSGTMKRDHVGIGEPEHLFTKWLGKLGNPYGSIQGMVMASFGISDETQDAVADAATAVFVAKSVGSQFSKAELARVLQEHKEVGELYGLE